MADKATVLFAGGGTGGHIYPNLAVWERLGAYDVGDAGRALRAHFAVSRRALDAEIVGKLRLGYTAMAVRPLSSRPWRWPGFIAALARGTKQAGRLIDEHHVRAIVATGGYVSGPALIAAQRRGLPCAMVNLDAMPGKANRRLSRRATKVFSVYDCAALPGATRIGLPLRRSAVGPDDSAEARAALALDPQRRTLLITGGSQGAQSVNQGVIAALRRGDVRAAIADWQVLHITGPTKDDEVRNAYATLGISASVMPFCDTMGMAWRSADIAISRSGAGSVAEAWANATPTLFLPYPFHKDDHQRLNAGLIVKAGGALLLRDLVDAEANAAQLTEPLIALASDDARRTAMADALREHQPPDGAQAVAEWVRQVVAG